MDRNTRTLIVVLVALAAAGVATFGVARVIRSRPVVEREVAHTYVVAAAHTLTVGAMVTPPDVKLIAWPERTPVPGAFAKIEDVVNRGVVAQVLENEPITPTKLAPVGGGAGLPPTITPGMRALSVRVNEVVGVAGFVVPGARVDVCVTMNDGNDTATRVVVSNVQVLTAGTRYDQEKSKSGEPIPTSVVTLLLTPEDSAARRAGVERRRFDAHAPQSARSGTDVDGADTDRQPVRWGGPAAEGAGRGAARARQTGRRRAGAAAGRCAAAAAQALHRRGDPRREAHGRNGQMRKDSRV